MQRVKNIDYDEDDLYDDEDDFAEEEPVHTAEDRENFATLTPVVRAELEEAGLQASDRDIHDALWHYFWDVGRSVIYLKNTKQPKAPQQDQRKEKPKSKFDEAAERRAEKTGERILLFDPRRSSMYETRNPSGYRRRGGLYHVPTNFTNY